MFKGVGRRNTSGDTALRFSAAPTLRPGIHSRAASARSSRRPAALVWEFMSGPIRGDVGIAGVLSTAGNVAFFGMINDFVLSTRARASSCGERDLGGRINANPMTFSVAGRQLVVIPAAGDTLLAFALSRRVARSCTGHSAKQQRRRQAHHLLASSLSRHANVRPDRLVPGGCGRGVDSSSTCVRGAGRTVQVVRVSKVAARVKRTFVGHQRRGPTHRLAPLRARTPT